jgi:hypothetical protein
MQRLRNSRKGAALCTGMMEEELLIIGAPAPSRTKRSLRCRNTPGIKHKRSKLLQSFRLLRLEKP